MHIKSQPTTPGAILRNTYIQFSHSLLDSLEHSLKANPLDAFSSDDWDILCHLPASTHWVSTGEPTTITTCELEYKVVQIKDMLDDGTEPQLITDPAERAELEAMSFWSPILCIPPGLRIPLGYLLEKLECMQEDQKREMDSLLELSYECLIAHTTNQSTTPRFLEVLSILQNTPIWAAYLHSKRGNPLARHTKKLANRLPVDSKNFSRVELPGHTHSNSFPLPPSTKSPKLN